MSYVAQEEESQVGQEQYLVLDFPIKNELITSNHYAIRIGASEGAERVEIGIDGCPFQPCRRASGYFWYDWSNFMAGRHTLQARATFRDGQQIESEPRKVRVELSCESR